MARKTYYLESEFGLTDADSMKTVGDKALGGITEARSLFPSMYRRMTTKGPAFLGRPLTDAEFLRLSWFDASWGQAKYAGQGGGQPIETGYLSSNNHISVPDGTFYTTIPTEFSSGEYEMQGPGYTEAGNDSINSKLTTWHENWLGHPEQRHGLVSGSWGFQGNLGYVEGTCMVNFRVDGRQDATDAIRRSRFEQNLVMSWKPGEVTDTARVFAENSRTNGIVLFGPTPTKLGNISAFQCVKAGLSIWGGWGGTISADLLSSDNCGAMLEFVPFNGEAGGTMWLDAIKNETMVATEGRTWRGQCIGILRGQYLLRIGVISGAVKGGRLPALFIVDDAISGDRAQGNYLEFGIKGMNYDYLVHDIRRGMAYPGLGDYRSGKVEYDAATGEMVRMGKQMTPVYGVAKYRVAHTPGSLAPIDIRTSANPAPYRHIIAGPPAFQETIYLDAPPSVTCEWVLGAPGAWSDCVNGQQTRTTPYVSSVPGCTPTTAKPADRVETQACTPPPAGGVIAVLNNYSNTDPNRSVPVIWKGVKRIRFTNLRVDSVPNFQRIAYRDAADTAGLRVDGTGRWKSPLGPNCTQSPAAFVPGTYPTAEIILPIATDFAFFLANRSNGAAWLFSADRIEVLTA